MRINSSSVAVTQATTKNISTRKKLLVTSVSLVLASALSAKTLLPTAHSDIQATTLLATEQQIQELLIIDTRVDDYQQLIIQRRKHLIPIVVRPEQDGLDVLTETLARFPNITALHLVSHGKDGKILLGKSWIDEQSLLQRTNVLHTLMRRSSPDQPDLLLYGCDVASSEKGVRFIKSLGRLSGFDVAASTNQTGEIAQGGDWILEKQIGDIKTSLAWNEDQLPDIKGTLAVFSVTNLDDAGAGSLREAVNNANTNPGADEINFSGAGATGTIALTSGELTITDELTITGPGSDQLAISGSNTSRIFNIPKPASPTPPVESVTITGITIKDGKVTGTGTGTEGGGISSGARHLIIQNSVISGNASDNQGGGIFHNGDGVAGAATPDGSLELTDVVLDGNSAGGNGGGLTIDSKYSVGTLNNVTVVNNSSGRDGAGVNIAAVKKRGFTIRNSNIRNNAATDDGGGLSIRSDYADIAIIDSTISNNSAGDDGGGIQGIFDYGTMLVSGSTISNNSAAVTSTHGRGAGFVNSSASYLDLTVRDSTISGNKMLGTGDGGGIFQRNSYSSSLTITNSSISSNSVADGNAGAIYLNIDGNASAYIDKSTISGNQASNSSGGLRLSGTYSYYTGDSGTVAITNTTISGNTATSGDGGGISIVNYSDLSLKFVTLAGNVAAATAGITGTSTYSTLNITNTVIAGNTATDGVSAPDFKVAITPTLSYTLIGDTTGSGITAASGTGLILNQDPLLATLVNNGGATLTHMPNVFSSPVIDMGDPTFSPPPVTDQRGTGYHRSLSTVPGSPVVDMGAVEVPGCVGSTLTVPPVLYSPGVKLSCHASVSLEVGNSTAVTGNALIHYYAPEHRVATGSNFSVELGSKVSFSAPMFVPVP